jgi:hypothetical protein
MLKIYVSIMIMDTETDEIIKKSAFKMFKGVKHFMTTDRIAEQAKEFE